MSAGVATLRQSESNALKGAPDSFFTGQGRDSSSTQNSKFKGKVKSKIVLTLLLGMLTAGGFFLTSSNSFLGPAWSANMTEETSLQDISGTLRSRRITRMMLKGDDMVTTSWTGAKKYTNLPKKYKDRFEKNNIEVKGSGKNLTLIYNGKNGKEEVSADQFISKLNNDVDFREDYQNTRRSNIVNFFDTAATKFFKRFGNIRNWFKDYKDSSDEEKNKKNYKETGAEHFDGSKSEYSSSGKMKKYDEDGNEIGDEWKLGVEGDTSTGSTDKADANSKARSYMADISSRISNGISDACGFMRIGSMISTSIAVMDKINYMKYFLGQIESVSKMMAGEGSDSPINEVLNFLTTPSTVEIDNVQDVKFGSSGNTELGKISTTGAPVEASGFQLQVSNIRTNSASAAPFATNRTTNAIASALEINGKSTASCAALSVGSSLFSIATTLTPGVGEVKIVASLAVKAVGKAFVDYFMLRGVEAVLGFLIPFIAQSLVNNMFEELTGIPAGHALASGGSISNMWLSRTGSGLMPSSRERAQEFAKAQDTVIAMNAEIDRKNRSPFDITSRNTFLGSIVNSLMPTIYSTRVSSITALTKSTTSSIASLTNNSVLADTGENQRYINTYGENCTELNDINATAADMYCNEINTTDMSTIDVLPNDPEYAKFIASQTENCDSEGNCEIIEHSTLDHFITYCVNRQSPFGVLDTNILDELSITSQDGLLGKILDFLGNLPILEDIWAIADAISADANPDAIAWASGEKCVNNNSDEWNNQMKYAQLYVMDQRILEQDGAYEEGQNPVEMAYERYLEKHPLDNSNSGTLARLTGMRKDDAQLVLDIAEYYNFLKDYDPSTRIAMTGETSEIKTSTDIAFEARANQNHLNQPQPTDEATTVIALIRPTIVYADLRTRSHAV